VTEGLGKDYFKPSFEEACSSATGNFQQCETGFLVTLDILLICQDDLIPFGGLSPIH
jgi:hypothetical protein